ncbi:CHRD domain-containing protein [Saliphagus sp. LR7]|uniref:CHRD domain-containing protein n=1 Tax=Saliphagus sp. LR7 TaxID=2282654 RepID=UPI000DF737D5|nr:CHRD domain-containing protein [Saliphagus sp. LR7]
MTDQPSPTDDRTNDDSSPGSLRRGFLGVSALIGAGALGATTTGAADDHDGEANESNGEMEGQMDATAMVTIEEQTTNGTWVNVAGATLSDGGFIAIHDSTLLDGDVLGSVIGVSEALDPGEHQGVVVPLFGDIPGTDFDREMLEAEETLIAMPHFDSNDSGAYEFIESEGEVDGPYVDDDGDAIVDDAMVSVNTDLDDGEMGGDEEMADEEESDEGMGEEEGMAFSLQEIVDNPEGYYVDVHTEQSPGGSVRAQLHGEPGTTEFSVEMSPDEVVDDGTEGATGTAHLVLDPEEEVICFDLSFCRITPPYESPANTATHIHEGDTGDTGPPVICFPDPHPRDPEAEGPRTSVGCLPGVLAFETGVE